MSNDPRAWWLRSRAGDAPRGPDEDFDCRLVDPIRLAKINPRRAAPFVLPEPVRFAASRIELVDATDLPANPSGWPVLSRRALDALLAVAPFDHRWWRAEIRDAQGRPPQREYGVIQLTTHVDALDLARSEFQPAPGHPSVPMFVRRGALRDDVAFPPLFRLVNYRAPLLVSVEGRRALLGVPVAGIEFADPATGL